MISFSDVSLWKMGGLAVSLFCSIEVAFFILFHRYLVPKANDLAKPIPYRDYGRQRSKLLTRILDRLEENCRAEDEEIKQRVLVFLSEWFHRSGTPTHRHRKNNAFEGPDFPDLTETPSSSPENSDDDEETTKASQVCLYKEDIDDFFSWAFFGKHFLTLLPWESLELDRIYELLEERVGITFPSKNIHSPVADTFHTYKPRCMTLEPVNAFHRPLAVYIGVYMMKVAANLFLYSKGFRRCVSSTGLVAWYRPPKNPSSNFLPLLFFHGIAPGGISLYLPMVLYGFASEQDRPVLLFENRAISCTMNYNVMSESDTVNGVVEILRKLKLDQAPLTLMGHSFGSCTITWLLASRQLTNAKQVVLLDPVAILLSEPDVMVNFLYAEEMDKIRMVASSELFTEYYLRRHFAWYNSEMWLEDLVDCELLVCLSEHDEIVNAAKVKKEVDRHDRSELIYWNNVGHADCVRSPEKWRQVKEAMLRQELRMTRED